VDLVRPAQAFKERKQPDMIDEGMTPVSALPGITGSAHDISGSKWGLAPAMDAGACPRLRASPMRQSARQATQQRLELFAFRWLDHIIGIEPEDIISGGVCQGRITSGGKVVNPDKIKDPRPERAGDFDGSILAPGIDDDDLIEQAPHRF
jgi:hypothetical protein